MLQLPNIGPVTISILPGRGTDQSGNRGSGIKFTFTVDRTPPVATFTLPPAVNFTMGPDPFPVSLTFSEDIKGFDESGVQITGGTISNFRGSGRSFDFDIVSALDSINLEIAKGTDLAGNSIPSSRIYRTIDRKPPTAKITSSYSATSFSKSPMPVLIAFDETVQGFTASSLQLTNATAGNLRDSGYGYYSVDIIPTTDGPVTISIPEKSFKDLVGNLISF